MTNETFLDFELHIAPQREHGYPVHIRLGGGGDFDGILPADIADWISTGDRSADGRRLWLCPTYTLKASSHCATGSV